MRNTTGTATSGGIDWSDYVTFLGQNILIQNKSNEDNRKSMKLFQKHLYSRLALVLRYECASSTRLLALRNISIWLLTRESILT